MKEFCRWIPIWVQFHSHYAPLASWSLYGVSMAASVLFRCDFCGLPSSARRIPSDFPPDRRVRLGKVLAPIFMTHWLYDCPAAAYWSGRSYRAVSSFWGSEARALKIISGRSDCVLEYYPADTSTFDSNSLGCAMPSMNSQSDASRSCSDWMALTAIGNYLQSWTGRS